MHIETLSLKKEITFKIALNLLKFSALVSVAIVVPLLSRSQFITGPIVNAVLFISVIILGWRNAILVGLIPSLVALLSGTLPMVLAPMVPFIATSNAVLVIIFGLLKNKNYWLAVVSASALKFLLLFGVSSIMISAFHILPQNLGLMMSYPQLLTALAGGIIAYIIVKSIIKRI